MSVRRIPVLQLIDGFATEERSGGASQFGIQLARHLDRSRFMPFVCGLWRYNTASERRWRQQLQSEGIETVILVDEPGPLSASLLRAGVLLQHFLGRVEPLVINSHFERGDLLSLWSKITHPTHPRIVRTMHTDEQWQVRPWLGRALNLLAFPWFFDAEAAISEATREKMDRRLGARLRGRHAQLIYNGISSTVVSSADRPGRSSQRRPARVMLVGRIELQKGHIHFLRAGAELLRLVPEVELWVVGTGSLLHAMQQEAAILGIGHAVRFLGQRSDILELLGEVDLLVSASLWEGFPTVLLEAMAAGVPVVATDVSGSRELVRNDQTGVLVPASSPVALAGAMLQQLCDRPRALRMAEQARIEVQRYTLEATAARYEQLYTSLVSS